MIAIMTMAGSGSRLQGYAENVPKPLIKLHNIPMFIHSLLSLNSLPIKKIIFILRQSKHLSEFHEHCEKNPSSI